MSQTGKCDARLAQLVYRGVITGALWTVSIDVYEHLGLVRSGKAPFNSCFLLSSVGKNCAAFTMFLGTFGGVSCASEMLRGRKDPLNTFLGGFAAGLLLTQNPQTRMALPLRTSLLTGLTCATFAAAIDAISHDVDA
ncbi:hypothetical protein H310_01014 [Aphanomyces invadans]|uniref:Mitochondrial import inner membrane translocase subunit TIM22 n=1 Tax=Aphanomyces invadans TaxID=157072 RepID=A0A024URG9_9STRA|nr:hypothetical protein H310_01014 [Aphanomyces invadans]ETW08432.1 hypothetical protein H310_01014 [Aphanomyces invadans]|eukprot:XP_008862237.1 hypothetical protein H310_01014 [Aphanomyces invadans]